MGMETCKALVKMAASIGVHDEPIDANERGRIVLEWDFDSGLWWCYVGHHSHNGPAGIASDMCGSPEEAVSDCYQKLCKEYKL